jgi:hypothetical protein
MSTVSAAKNFTASALRKSESVLYVFVSAKSSRCRQGPESHAFGAFLSDAT